MARTKNTDDRKVQGSVFRETMKMRREQAGLTQNELAVRVGVSVELIRAIEGGRSSNPSFFIALDILNVLGTHLGEVGKWAGIK